MQTLLSKLYGEIGIILKDTSLNVLVKPIKKLYLQRKRKCLSTVMSELELDKTFTEDTYLYNVKLTAESFNYGRKNKATITRTELTVDIIQTQRILDTALRTDCKEYLKPDTMATGLPSFLPINNEKQYSLNPDIRNFNQVFYDKLSESVQLVKPQLDAYIKSPSFWIMPKNSCVEEVERSLTLFKEATKTISMFLNDFFINNGFQFNQ